MYAESDLVDEAIALLDEAQGLLDGEAEDRLMLVKTGICVENNRFDCVFEAYERRYEINPDLASDTTFLAGVIGASDFAGDTTGSLKWTHQSRQPRTWYHSPSQDLSRTGADVC